MKRVKVKQFDLYGNFIKEFNSIQSVEDELGISKSHISACCLGKRKMCGGFLWSTGDSVEPYLKETVFMYDLSGNYIKSFINTAEATQFLNLKKNTISEVIDTDGKTSRRISIQIIQD